MKAIILCGGMGTRLREYTEVRPKPMVEVGGRPMLWHIMKIYAYHGITDFVLCLGYKGHVIKDYFLNYEAMNSDFTVELGSPDGMKLYRTGHNERGWRVTLAETGESTMTGARVLRAAEYLDAGDENFMVTYGDGVSDVNLRAVLEFHRQHGKTATLTGVRPPSRFGELERDGNEVVAFSEKPPAGQGLINGGFFCFRRSFLNYLADDAACVLEREPLERCAAESELCVFEHPGYWQCMDTYRDWENLEKLWQTGEAPWHVWRWDLACAQRTGEGLATGHSGDYSNVAQKKTA
ncbi:MAG: glucose-1-phosphate cytidylyltransferase [Pirellulaceae bacterium]|nr:glucose-1-phosphate cytidylyltransferase [Pirellulaceae bacterium]